MVYVRSLALVMTLIGAVSALPSRPFVPESETDFADIVARKAAPAGWSSWGFEDYNVYHDRYNALDCKHKHDTTFFSQCCGPLKKGQQISSRPAQCNPSSTSTVSANSTAAAITSVAAPTGTSVSIYPTDDEYDDCEDDGDDETADDGTDDGADAVTSAVTSVATSAADDRSTSKTTKTATATSTAAASQGTGQVFTGGYATFYTQNGNAGACGKVNPDSALIGAIDHERWGKSSYGIKSDLCGQKVKITNPANKKSVTIVIADVCPSCKNKNSIDLSTGAFTQIATKAEGMVKIEWQFV